MARHGVASHGMERRGSAGVTRQASRGGAWPGEARIGRRGIDFRSSVRRFIVTAIWGTTYIATRGVEAGAAYAELEAIRERDGIVRPAAVVDASRPDDATLHPIFEWDDFLAAERHREWQARQIIRAVKIVESSGQESRAYVNVSVESQPAGYQSTEIAVQRPDEWLDALRMFERKISELRRTVEELEMLATQSESHDRLASLAVAARALQLAESALRH